jgi:hypothetical protein
MVFSKTQIHCRTTAAIHANLQDSLMRACTCSRMKTQLRATGCSKVKSVQSAGVLHKASLKYVKVHMRRLLHEE